MARKLEIEIVGDASSFKRALGDSDSATSKFGRALGGMAKAGALAAGAAGVGALFVTLRAGIGEFTEATKVAAQTEAVIKSTGGVAGITAKHVDALAESIMKKSGVDDEAIKSGQNLLLSFTDIRNEAGKGNAVFDRATQAIVDYSVRTGRDATSAARLFGRALQDPVKGLGGLARAGVVLSDSQKDVIKGLVESGDKMGAQRFILDQLETRYKGAAEAAGNTLPGQLNILKETFNNLAGDLVSKAVPAVTTFVTFLNDKGLPVIEDVFGKIGEAVGPAITKFGEAFKALGPILTDVLEPLGKVIQERLVPVFVQLQDIGVRAMKAIGDVIRENGPQLRQIFENLGQVISNLAKVVIPILDIAFTKVLPIAIRILIPILALVSEAIVRIQNVVISVAGVLRTVLVGAFNIAQTAGEKIAAFYNKVLVPVLNVVGEAVKIYAGIWRTILATAFNVAQTAAEGVKTAFEWFREKALPIFQKLVKPLGAAIGAITGFFKGLWDMINNVIGAIERLIDLAGKIGDVAGSIGGAVGKIGGLIPGRAAGGPVSAGQVYKVGEKGPEWFVPAVSGAIVPSFVEPARVGTGGGGGAGASIVVHVHGNLLTTKRELEDMVRSALYDVNRRNPGAIPGVA